MLDPSLRITEVGDDAMLFMGAGVGGSGDVGVEMWVVAASAASSVYSKGLSDYSTWY